jgi:hypothetical protein
MSRRAVTPESEPLPANPRSKEQEWLNEEVSVEFINVEEPGLMIKFCYGSTKDPKNYTLMHGGKYKLPRHVVKHINSRETPDWKWRPDGHGGMQKTLVGMKPRFQCREVFAA